jgi:hypothetical protein
MAKNKSSSGRKSGKSSKSKDSGLVRFFKAIWWLLKIIFALLFSTFRAIFIALSWIVKMLILGGDKLVEMFKKRREAKRENNPDRVEHYVPFTIVKSLSGGFKGFETTLAKKDSTIGIILGARGSGKSAFGLKLLENLHAVSGRKIVAMGFKAGELPSWMHTIDDIELIENNSYVLIDEGGILFNARQGFSDANQLLSKLLLIARHKDLSIMFISQNSSNLEINAIRQADYLVLKPSSLLQLDFERKKIKDIYLEAAEDFAKFKNTKGLTYIYSDTFKGFVSNPLPTFWTQSISKSFRNKDKGKEKERGKED